MDIKIERTVPQPSRHLVIDYEHLSSAFNRLDVGLALSIKRVSNITDLRKRLSSRFDEEGAFEVYNTGNRTVVVKKSTAIMHAKPRV